MTPDKKKIIDRIIKLIQLGTKNTQEAEMMAALTKAKSLMAQHDIHEAEVQGILDARTDAQHAPRFNIHEHTAYTRKMRNFARYDELVAWAVAHLTSTHPTLTHRRTLQGWYVSMNFIGTEFDVQVASALFLILLQDVRARTRDKFGHARWGKEHTSYACGMATRMAHRAQEMARDLTPNQQQTVALVIQTKQTAIQAYVAQHFDKKHERRATKADSVAFTLGYLDGAHVSLNKRGLN